MASRFLDMALDDVAKSRSANNRSPQPRRGGGAGGRGAGPSGRDSPNRPNRSAPYSRNNPAEDRWTHDKFDESNQRSASGAAGGRGGDSQRSQGTQGAQGNAKIIVENLHYAVTLEDIKELFDTHAGPVKFAEVKYDPSGRSTGVATILFQAPEDASKAIKKLDGIALDGQPMKIKYAPVPAHMSHNQDRRSGPSKDEPKRDVFSRLGSSEADIASRLGRPNPVPKVGGGSTQSQSQSQSQHQARKPHQGGRGGSSRSSAPREKKAPQVKTAEELDAEMDTYMGDA